MNFRASNTIPDSTNDLEQIITDIWKNVLSIEHIGRDDNFFELGGDSLRAIQASNHLSIALQVKLPQNALFEKLTVASLADLIDTLPQTTVELQNHLLEPVSPEVNQPIPFLGSQVASNPNFTANEVKERIGQLYDLYTKKLNTTIYASTSKFMNYGYVDDGSPQDAVSELPKYLLHKHNIKLVLELVGNYLLTNCQVLDVSCGRGGNAEVIAKYFDAKEIIGLDLSAEAISFCQANYSYNNVHFLVGDAEKLPFEDNQFDVVTNIESSHSYGNLFAFYREVYRVLKQGGYFLYTDLILTERLHEYLSYLNEIGFTLERNRDITKQVLLSCEKTANRNLEVIETDKDSQVMKEFLAVPGSKFNAGFQNGNWTYRILRMKKK